jgi:hypothetical protein
VATLRFRRTREQALPYSPNLVEGCSRKFVHRQGERNVLGLRGSGAEAVRYTGFTLPSGAGDEASLSAALRPRQPE